MEIYRGAAVAELLFPIPPGSPPRIHRPPLPVASVAPLNTLHDSSKWEPTSSLDTHTHSHMAIPTPRRSINRISIPIPIPETIVILIVIGMLGHKQRPGHWRVNWPPSSSELRRVESSRVESQAISISCYPQNIHFNISSIHTRTGFSRLYREKKVELFKIWYSSLKSVENMKYIIVLSVY